MIAKLVNITTTSGFIVVGPRPLEGRGVLWTLGGGGGVRHVLTFMSSLELSAHASCYATVSSLELSTLASCYAAMLL